MPTAYIIWQPDDKTKGIDSHKSAVGYTLSKACAEACAVGRGGSKNGVSQPGPISEHPFEVFGELMIPISYLHEVKPTDEHLKIDAHNKRRDAAIKRAREAGVNIDDLALIAMPTIAGVPF